MSIYSLKTNATHSTRIYADSAVETNATSVVDDNIADVSSIKGQTAFNVTSTDLSAAVELANDTEVRNPPENDKLALSVDDTVAMLDNRRSTALADRPYDDFLSRSVSQTGDHVAKEGYESSEEDKSDKKHKKTKHKDNSLLYFLYSVSIR
jgi:hypothetical protein